MNLRIDKYDFYSENFENYFKSKIESITEAQKNKLPDSLKYKIFKNKEIVCSMLSFKEKVYVLNICFDANVVIHINDPGVELGAEDFKTIEDTQRGKVTNTELLQSPKIQSGFVMGDRNLFQAMTYLNHMYTSEIYTLFRKIKVSDRSKKDKNYARGKEVVAGVTDLILKHEQYKKKIIMEFNITPQELYALLYFSTGEKFGKHFAQRDFKFAFNSTGRMLTGTIKNLTDKGYLNRRGKTSHYRYTLTAKGQDLLNKIISRIIDNYLQ